MDKSIRFFSSVDEDFVRQNFKDRAAAEKLIASNRLRAKIVTVVIGSFLMATTIAIVFARTKNIDAQAVHTNVGLLKTQIDQCAESTKRQLEDATKARSRAEEANRAIQAQLEACSKKKK